MVGGSDRALIVLYNLVYFFETLKISDCSGKLMEYNEAKELEEEYSQDASIGSYMYFFKHQSRRWCVDATSGTCYNTCVIYS